jgi:hypothetical protein
LNSNNIWEANLRVIESHYPGLAAQLLQAAPEDPEGGTPPLRQEDIRVETAASGVPTLIIRGIHIHSPRDPVREGRRLGETPEGDGPVILLGFGLGYAAEGTATGRPLIVVERHPAILKKALESRDLRPFLTSHSIIFALGGSGEAVTTALRVLESHIGAMGPPALIRNRPLMGLDEVWYAGVEQRIRTWSSRDDINTATLGRFGKRWVRNLAANREAIRDLPGISRLAQCLAPKTPVLLVAAGPSLDGIAPLLPALADRAVVVAVDTSQRLLLERGIDPDFTVAVDPQYWNTRHLDRAPAPRTCLIAESAVYPSALRQPFARTFLCSSLFPLGRFIEDRLDPKGALGAGGSVATTAWDFARTLGGSSLWIAGLDLSFPGLKTHFRGALFETRSLAESSRFVPAETWSVRALRDGYPFLAPAADGGKVLTDRRLALYSTWFANQFRRYPGLPNYSLSPAGLAIPGLPSVSPEELLALPPRRREIDRLLREVFTRIDEDFNAPAKRERRAAQYDAACTILLRGLETIKDRAEEAAALASKTAARRSAVTAAEQERALKRLDEVNQTIMRSEVKAVAGFLFPPVAELEASVQTPASNPLGRHLELSEKLYRSLAGAAQYNLDVLHKRQGAAGE